jgi:hypothetical protein
LRSYDSAPRPPSSPPSRQQLVCLSQSSCVPSVELDNERGGKGWAWSQIIWPRESMVRYKSFSTFWYQVIRRVFLPYLSSVSGGRTGLGYVCVGGSSEPLLDHCKSYQKFTIVHMHECICIALSFKGTVSRDGDFSSMLIRQRVDGKAFHPPFKYRTV